jgi:hypothetical protein
LWVVVVVGVVEVEVEELLPLFSSPAHIATSPQAHQQAALN